MPLAADRSLVAIDVTGPDRIAYLDDVTTQQFRDLPSGTVTGALVLDGKGVPLAMAWALVDDLVVTLLAPPSAADHLLDVVARRTFLAQVAFARRDVPVTSLVVTGDQDMDATLQAAGLATPADQWRMHGDVVVARHAFGVELVGVALAEVVGLGLGDLDQVDGDDLSVVVGAPRWGIEVAAGRLPEEYGLLPTHVHLAKGCYPGQEPIAHMWMLGRPRRRLAVVALDQDVEVDADVLTGRRGDRGLAWVGPDATPGTAVADGVTVTDVVGADRDVLGWTPNQTRRRDRDGRPDLPRRQP